MYFLKLTTMKEGMRSPICVNFDLIESYYGVSGNTILLPINGDDECNRYVVLETIEEIDGRLSPRTV